MQRENFHTKFDHTFRMEQLPGDKREQCSNPFSDWLRGSCNQKTTITMLFIGQDIATTTVPFGTLQISVQ